MTQWVEVKGIYIVSNIVIPTGIHEDNYSILRFDDATEYTPFTLMSIYQYNCNADEWKISHKFALEKGCASIYGRYLYILQKEEIVQINCENFKQCKFSVPKMIKFWETSCIAFEINSIFLGKYIWQYKGNNNSLLHQKSEICYNKSVDFGHVIHNKPKKILIFGGVTRNNHQKKTSQNILEYDIVKNIWETKQCQLLYKYSELLCLLWKKFVIICGGYDRDTMQFSNDITIYSIRQDKIFVSMHKCPSKSLFAGIITNNSKIQQKTVYGYIRKKFTANFPDYLSELITTYITYNFVYLLDLITQIHWKINILDIVNCV